MVVTPGASGSWIWRVVQALQFPACAAPGGGGWTGSAAGALDGDGRCTSGGEVPVTPHFSPVNRKNHPSAYDFIPSQMPYRMPVFSPKTPHQEPRS